MVSSDGPISITITLLHHPSARSAYKATTQVWGIPTCSHAQLPFLVLVRLGSGTNDAVGTPDKGTLAGMVGIHLTLACVLRKVHMPGEVAWKRGELVDWKKKPSLKGR